MALAKTLTPSSAKDRGHLATLKLVVEAQSREWLALWPEGDNASYDVVLDTGNGKFVRVQVKSCLKKDDKHRHSYIIGHGADHKKQYSSKTVDVIALHAFDEDAWWFIPVDAIKGYTNIHVGKQGKWDQYKNSWEAFA